MTRLLAILFAVLFAVAAGPAAAADRIGVLFLHGKNPGGANATPLRPIKERLDKDGAVTRLPDMPWSKARYIDGDWAKAMAEIAGHVAELKRAGATRIVLVGHSTGCPAAMAFAASGGAVDAIVLLAPGHVPLVYYTVPRMKDVRDSIDAARALVAAGRGGERQAFNDNNQGTPLKLTTTAAAFLSYFDPESDAEMSRTAPRVPKSVRVMWAVGTDDPIFQRGRGYVFDKLPANPANLYLEVPGGHADTPKVAADRAVAFIQAVGR